jgi:hypothetical protein
VKDVAELGDIVNWIGSALKLGRAVNVMNSMIESIATFILSIRAWEDDALIAAMA